MKRITILPLTVWSTTLLFVFLVLVTGVRAQDATDSKPTKSNKPVKDIFSSGYLINNQTVEVPTAKTLEFVIQHRFGKLNSTDFDLLGLYAPANIRIGLEFTLTNKLQIGIGTTKNDKLQDFNYKYAIFRQTRSGSMPVSLVWYGNATIDVRKEAYPTTANRLSYFNQLILARKISDRISLQLAASYAHFNMVDPLVKHDNIGVSFNGRAKVTDDVALIFEYDHNLTSQNSTAITVKPNLSLGIETATSGHTFQLFIGTASGISPQHNLLYNSNDFTKKDLLIGFNITRLWSF